MTPHGKVSFVPVAAAAVAAMAVVTLWNRMAY